ncbi:fungal-specific transcription factor domain-domain-containing protein, partial [Coniella lustricola]
EPVTAPQPKRRRVAEDARVRSAKACQRCRRLKEKCDGRQPCVRCQRSGRDCEFAPPGSGASASFRHSASANVQLGILADAALGRDGQAAAAAAAAAATATATATATTARHEERTRCLERLVQHLLGDVPTDLNNLRRMVDKAGQRAGSKSDAGSVKGGAEDLDDLTLEDENFTVKALSQSTTHYSGEFSHWNFSQKLRPAAAAAANRLLPRAKANANMRILEYWRATQLQSPKQLVQSVLSCLPPRAVSNFLVHIYFQFAQVNCFYVEDAWLRKKLDFLYEAPGHVTSEDSGWVCSVLMVLAIGTQFAHMAAGPPPPPPHDKQAIPPTAMGMAGGADADVGVTFYQMASKLIPDIITIASLESVQACLLLAHYALPLDTSGLAYTYLGLGIKMAIQNGMHRRYTGSDLDAWTIETRNRLWWTAYTVERRVSVLHGRPASIAPTEVDAELPKDATGSGQLDEPSRFKNMSAFIDMTLRLSDAANAITLLRRCPKNLQQTYFERVVDVCQSLHAWWATLPAEAQNPSPSSPMFRSHVHLQLCLHLNDIFVGRPFIFSSAPTGTSPAASMSSPGAASVCASASRRPDTSDSSPKTTTGANDSSKPPAHPHPRPRSRAALVARAVQAAIHVIHLLHTLHTTTGLARSSYTEFSSCRAALLVMLAQSVNSGPQSEAHELKDAIDSGMVLIRGMAAGNVSTQSETSVIEALEIAVRRLHEMQQQQ